MHLSNYALDHFFLCFNSVVLPQERGVHKLEICKTMNEEKVPNMKVLIVYPQFKSISSHPAQSVGCVLDKDGRGCIHIFTGINVSVCMYQIR